jgi:hypothetical protein
MNTMPTGTLEFITYCDLPKNHCHILGLDSQTGDELRFEIHMISKYINSTQIETGLATMSLFKYLDKERFAVL